MPAGGAMSAAVTTPGPCLRKYMCTGSSCSEETTSSFRFKMMSVTSSETPGTVENSCSTPSILMLVTAAPGMEESSVRRIEFPIVYPKPGSSGSMVNRERNSSTGSSVRVGRCAMSIVPVLSACPLYDRRLRSGGSRRQCAGRASVAGQMERLLRVVLDDQLLLDERVNLRA